MPKKEYLKTDYACVLVCEMYPEKKYKKNAALLKKKVSFGLIHEAVEVKRERKIYIDLIEY